MNNLSSSQKNLSCVPSPHTVWVIEHTKSKIHKNFPGALFPTDFFHLDHTLICYVKLAFKFVLQLWSDTQHVVCGIFIEMSFTLHKNLISVFFFFIWLYFFRFLFLFALHFSIQNIWYTKHGVFVEWEWLLRLFTRFKSSGAHLLVNIYVPHDTNRNSFIFFFCCFFFSHRLLIRLYICGLV